MLDNSLKRHFEDKIKVCLNKNILQKTSFLDPMTQSHVMKLCRFHSCNFILEGGHLEAERKILFLLPSYIEKPKLSQSIAVLSIESKQSFKHPDVLGALINLGVKRNCIGDICIQSTEKYYKALVYCSHSISSLLSSLDQVGRCKVECKLIDIENTFDVKNKETAELVTGSVASLRLDTIISLAFSVSRSRACELIESGCVQLNWQSILNNSKMISKNDCISVRKYGRAVLIDIKGLTKKGRTFISIKCLI